MVKCDQPIKLPSGVLAFGPGITMSMIHRLTKEWEESLDNFRLVLILAGSLTAEVEGISAAGATSAARRYTAVADAELLLKGPLRLRKWPLPKLEAGVSPALLSHVASSFLGVRPLILTSGLSQEPNFPHVQLDSQSVGPAQCLSSGKAMEIERVNRLIDKGFQIGKSLSKPLLLTECVPGGTTTAYAVMSGLGLSVDGLISGSARKPPFELKKKLVNKGLSNAQLDKKFSPKSLMAAVGDPFQPIAVGILLGARHANQSVLLGGGSQMLAILALALSEVNLDFRSAFVEGVAIGTTSWLLEESLSSRETNSSFLKLMNEVGKHFKVNLVGLASGLRFKTSTEKVLRDYEKGYIKEGVGAGALTLLAQLKGISSIEFIQSCDDAVKQLNDETTKISFES